MPIPARTAELLQHATQHGLAGAALGVVNAAGEKATLTLGYAQTESEKIPLAGDEYWDLASLT